MPCNSARYVETPGHASRLAALLDAQLWPRHIQISMGDAVWKATDVMISGRRAGERTWAYIAETQSKSEPGTPSEDDETACSDTE